jgi:hypothetical protein
VWCLCVVFFAIALLIGVTFTGVLMVERDRLQPSSWRLRSQCGPVRDQRDVVAITDDDCTATTNKLKTFASISAAHAIATDVPANLPWTGQRIHDICSGPVALGFCGIRSHA